MQRVKMRSSVVLRLYSVTRAVMVNGMNDQPETTATEPRRRRGGARGNPQASQESIKRISNALIALLIYVFLYAIANFLVPGGMIK